MARTNAVMTRTFTGNGKQTVGKWVSTDGKRTVEFSASRVSDGIMQSLLEHGIAAKIGDAAAMSSATVAEKFDAMQSVVNNLYADKWNGARESHTTLIEAILETRPTAKRESVAEVVRKWTDAERNAVKRDPAIKKILDRIEAETAKASGVKATDLLAKIV